MQIKVAHRSGFCFGVKRAIGIAEKTLSDSKGKRQKIYSLGPVIHNPQVVRELSDKGLEVVTDIDNINEGTVIISSHGTTKELIEKIKKKGLTLIDATCPFVKNAHNIVKGLKKDSYRIVIVGDKEHPEVKGLLSLASPEIKSKKVGIVSQTTQNKSDFINSVLEVLKDDFSEVRVFNTICSDTSERQESARSLLEESDVMVVVGGKNSANTKRLHQICKESGVDSYHIETDKELKKEFFIGKKCVGVVSGASTPEDMVEKVVKKIKAIK